MCLILKILKGHKVASIGKVGWVNLRRIGEGEYDQSMLCHILKVLIKNVFKEKENPSPLISHLFGHFRKLLGKGTDNKCQVRIPLICSTWKSMNLLVLHIGIWVRGCFRSRNDSKTSPSSKHHLSLGDILCELEGVVPLLGSSAGLCFLQAAQLVWLSFSSPCCLCTLETEGPREPCQFQVLPEA